MSPTSSAVRPRCSSLEPGFLSVRRIYMPTESTRQRSSTFPKHNCGALACSDVLNGPVCLQKIPNSILYSLSYRPIKNKSPNTVFVFRVIGATFI